MKHKPILVALLGLLAVGLVAANLPAEVPPDTASVLKRASAEAKAAKKNVWVIFHASWCGWCKKLDAFIANPEFKPILERSFVIVHLDVLETPAMKNLENPGGNEYLAKLGGDKAGLPFFAMIDPSGKVIIDSMMATPGKAEKQNTGHPFAPEEVAHFMAMLQKAAPAMSSEDRGKLIKFLSSQKK